MEMTIEESLQHLKSYNHGFTGYAGNLQDSIDVAIVIMQKYQKIEDIYYHQTGRALEDSLREVIEGDKNN